MRSTGATVSFGGHGRDERDRCLLGAIRMAQPTGGSRELAADC